MERYRRLIELRDRGILNLKDRLEIVIYGSYYPKSEKDKLIALRDFLRQDGYKKTNLVEDYPDDIITLPIKEAEVFLEKSYACLELADANFFVFTLGGKDGRSTELAYLCNILTDRVYRTVVFYEEVDGVSSLHKLNIGLVSRYRIEISSFKNVPELLELGKSKAFNYLMIFKNELALR